MIGWWIRPHSWPSWNWAVNSRRSQKKMSADAEHFLDYLATHPITTIGYHALDVILNNHSDASYLSVSQRCSRTAGHLFLGWLPEKNRPIRVSGQIFSLCEILKFVSSSAVEAEVGALFINTKQARIFCLAINEFATYNHRHRCTVTTKLP